MEITGPNEVRINSGSEYLEVRREKLYTIVELHKEIVSLIRLEESRTIKEGMDKPEGCMGAGSYRGQGIATRKDFSAAAYR